VYEAFVLAVLLCGAVYVAMRLAARRTRRLLAEVRKSEQRFRGLTEL
jgi:hypothetical protein